MRSYISALPSLSTTLQLSYFTFAVLGPLAVAGRVAGLVAATGCALTLPRIFVKTRTNGAAIAIDEYVPIMIPTTIAKAKWLMISPPKMNSASTVKNVNPEAMIVRLNV